MARSAFLFLIVAVIALSFAPKAYAFGAGNIPGYSYVEDKAFRHGDIEDIIHTMAKTVGGGFFGRSVKFSGLDVKRIYFGNWLRDYSQAVDTAGLGKLPLQTILNLVMVLGFLAHGYATAEFEVTKERLGCYLPTEHIDNPKGYPDNAKTFDQRLRGPVDPRELEIDPQTGMKNYIANENGHWDTSKALARRTLLGCIEMGRRFKQSGKDDDQYEAFRLLGQALHTLEDFSAHSNFCELVLISMGHNTVFPHVGRNVKVRAPNGQDVYPLVTGTFGGADFVHSLMGEASDKLSEASVSELTKSMNNARSISEGQSASSNALRQLFFDLPGGVGGDLSRDMDDVNNIRASNQDPSTMSPQELHKVLWQILSFRDKVSKRIENTLEKIPGLNAFLDKLSGSVSVFIMTTLEPFVKPLLGQASTVLHSTSQQVIDSHDQYEVWNNYNASDPTHSYLSKDHFAVLLNEPAGKIAQCIVRVGVEKVVTAWEDSSINAQQTVEEILQCLFHPAWHNRNSRIQTEMIDVVTKWFNEQGSNQREIINRLSSENVKAGKNRRIGDNSASTGHVHNSLLPDGGLQQVLAEHKIHVPGANVLNAGQDLMGGKMPWQQGFGSGGPNAWRGGLDEGDVQAAENASHSYGQQQGGYGGGGSGYGQQQQGSFGQQQSYNQGGGGGYGHDQGGYGQQQHGGYGGGGGGYGQQEQGGYGQQQSYGQQQGSYGSYQQPPGPPGGHHGGHQQGGWNQSQNQGHGSYNQPSGAPDWQQQQHQGRRSPRRDDNQSGGYGRW